MIFILLFCLFSINVFGNERGQFCRMNTRDTIYADTVSNSEISKNDTLGQSILNRIIQSSPLLSNSRFYRSFKVLTSTVSATSLSLGEPFIFYENKTNELSYVDTNRIWFYLCHTLGHYLNYDYYKVVDSNKSEKDANWIALMLLYNCGTNRLDALRESINVVSDSGLYLKIEKREIVKLIDSFIATKKINLKPEAVKPRKDIDALIQVELSKNEPLLDLDILKEYVLDNGGNANIVGASGWTCLHEAALQNDTFFTRCLLKKGVPINKKDINGESALSIASSNKCWDVFNMLNKVDSVDKGVLTKSPLKNINSKTK